MIYSNDPCIFKNIKGNLSVNSEDDIIEIRYDIECKEFVSDFIAYIQVQKRTMPIQEFAVKVNQADVHGRAHLHKRNLKMLDGTSVVGKFDVLLVVNIDKKYIILCTSQIFVEPLPATNKGYVDLSNIVGTNYTNSSAVNQIQFWLEFNTKEISKELRYAKKIGLNALRVYLHNYVYDTNKDLLLDNILEFTDMCSANNIQLVFVLFDDCWYGDDRVFNFKPIAGDHNGRWAKCPLDSERVITNYSKFQGYVKDVVNLLQDSTNILAFDIFNEPKNSWTGNQIMDTDFTDDLIVNGFNWAREAKCEIPLISCWDGNVYGDIDNQHNYCTDGKYEPGTLGNKPDMSRGTLVTEAGARAWSTDSCSYGSSMEWIHWLKKRKSKSLPRPGVFLTWELMVGNSNCRWSWQSSSGDAEPPIPWCGLIYPDGTPVSISEVESIKEYMFGENNCLMLCDFQDDSKERWSVIKGNWEIVSNRHTKEIYAQSEYDNVIEYKAENWEDYIVQLTAKFAGYMNDTSEIGLLVRVSGDENSRRYYFCGFSSKEVFIYKCSDNIIKKLCTVSIKNVQVNSRNSLKVSVYGNDIRVFFNEPRTPIIQYIDNDSPILSGYVGLKASSCNAGFDDIAVVPYCTAK